MNKEKIIEMNKERLGAISAVYNPITGEGSTSVPRQWIDIEGFPIESINIPASVRSIGTFAFAKCYLKTVVFGNTEGWNAGGAAILSSQLLDPTAAAECVALNARVDWKMEDSDNTEE